MKRLALIFAFALLAAACGSSATSDSFTSPTSVATTTAAAGEGGEPTTTSTDGATTSTSTAAPVDPAELPDSDYPDIVVTDLAGGTVNLRELALGTQPTLLWFWAPH